MPVEDRVWLDQRRDPFEEPAAERLSFDREALPLWIREPEPTTAEHLSEYPVLLTEVLDRVLLATVQKPCEDRDGERKGRAGAAHSTRLSRWARCS
jgi:hypothetical protein